MKINILALVFTLTLFSCSETEDRIIENTGNGIYHRIKTKFGSSLIDLDLVSYELNDPLSTSYYQVEDTIIGFWGISRNVSLLNSLPYFQELDLGSNYYESRKVISLKSLYSNHFEFTIEFINNEGEEDLRFARFIIAPADSIPFQNNTNDKLLAAYQDQKSGIFSDSIYGAIDLFDPYSHLKAFKKDAARHGVDLSHISKEDMDIVWESNSYTESVGYAFKICDANKVGIGIREIDWDERIIADFNEFRISLMWHEFGHSILGLQHLCQGGHIMSGRHQNPRVIENQLECDSEYVTIYELGFNHADSYRNFQRAVKNMFDGFFQMQYDCNLRKQQVVLD